MLATGADGSSRSASDQPENAELPGAILDRWLAVSRLHAQAGPVTARTSLLLVANSFAAADGWAGSEVLSEKAGLHAGGSPTLQRRTSTGKSTSGTGAAKVPHNLDGRASADAEYRRRSFVNGALESSGTCTSPPFAGKSKCVSFPPSSTRRRWPTSRGNRRETAARPAFRMANSASC